MRVALRFLTVAAALLVLASLALRAQPGGGPGTGQQTRSQTLGTLVAVPRGAVTRVCPPGPAPTGRQAGTDAQFTGAETSRNTLTRIISYGVARAEPDTLTLTSAPLAGQPQTWPGRTTRALAQAGADTDQALIAVAEPAQDEPTGSAATGFTDITGGDLTGAAAATCSPPAPTVHLTGGAVGGGHHDRLLVVNPGESVVTVDVTVLTSSGPVRPAEGRAVPVAPGTSRGFQLDVLVPDATPTAVQVRGEGGQISAYLTEAVLHGLVPRGIETVAPAAPGTDLTLVPVPGPATLRLANPGRHDLTARWKVIGAGAQQPGEGSVQVPGGAVVEVPLAHTGSAAVRVEATAAVLASATWQAERPGADPAVPEADHARIGPAPALTGPTLVALPPATSTLTLAAGTPAAVSVRQLDATGTPIGPDRPVAVAVEGVREVALDPDAVALRLDVTTGPVHAAVVSRSGPGGAHLTAATVAGADQPQENARVLIRARPPG